METAMLNIKSHPELLLTPAPSLCPRDMTMVPMSGCLTLSPVFVPAAVCFSIFNIQRKSLAVCVLFCLQSLPTPSSLTCMSPCLLSTVKRKSWKKVMNFQSEIPLQRQGGLIKIVLVCVPRVLEILEILGHTGAIIQWWSSWNKQIISYQKLASILSSVCLMRVGHVSLSV